MKRIRMWAIWSLRLVGWVSLLGWIAGPWSHLGGLVAERLRWTHSLLLALGAIVGFTTGLFVRDLRAGGGPAHRRATRRALYPALVGGACAVVALEALGHPDASNIAVTAVAAFVAGLDAAAGLPRPAGGRRMTDDPVTRTGAEDRRWK